MKPIHFLTVILLAALFCTGGCDVFRKLAGRPASPEIEAARTAIEAERAARRADSLKNASLMEAKADSVSAVRLLDSLRVNVINSSVMGGVISAGDVPEYQKCGRTARKGEGVRLFRINPQAWQRIFGSLRMLFSQYRRHCGCLCPHQWRKFLSAGSLDS